MFTVVRPVTHIADTAVKRASGSGVDNPEALAAGSISTVVVIAVRRMNTAIVVTAAELPTALRKASPRPAGPEGRRRPDGRLTEPGRDWLR